MDHPHDQPGLLDPSTLICPTKGCPGTLIHHNRYYDDQAWRVVKCSHCQYATYTSIPGGRKR